MLGTVWLLGKAYPKMLGFLEYVETIKIGICYWKEELVGFPKDKFSSIYMPYFQRSLKCYPAVPLEFTFNLHYPLDVC